MAAAPNPDPGPAAVPAVPAASDARRPATARRDLGQSLTELALIFPIILLLTLAALDFGRIYLGYINVQNMARIAANYAANNPLAWGATPDTAVQTRYRNQILEDTAATNCDLPRTSGGQAIVPDPSFADTNLDGTATSLGDTVKVQITCTFRVLTPVIGNIVGNAIPVTAESDFPVKAGMTSVAGPTGGAGSELVARIAIGGTYSDVHDWYVTQGPDATVQFTDASYGQVPIAWVWAFSDGTPSVTDQNPAHTFHCTSPTWYGFCVYEVHQRVDSAADRDWEHIYVYVEYQPQVTASASPLSAVAGSNVTFTGTIIDAAGTNPRWEFSDGATATGLVVTHAFASAGSAWGKFIVDYPSPIDRREATATVNVTVPYCVVPSLINVKFNDANAIWQAPIAPATVRFTGTVKRAAGAPNGNFKITAQSIAAGHAATAPCTSDVYVSAP